MFGMFISTFFLWNLTGFFFFFTFGRNCYGKVEFAWHLRCQILRMNHLADICTHSPTTLRDWQARRWLLPKGSKRSTDPRLPFQWVYKATWKSHGLLCGLLSVFSSPTGLQAPGGSIHGDKKNELGEVRVHLLILTIHLPAKGLGNECLSLSFSFSSENCVLS